MNYTKEQIEKLKQRRYPYQNNEGKWGFTDVFGEVVEPAHLDYILMQGKKYTFRIIIGY